MSTIVKEEISSAVKEEQRKGAATEVVIGEKKGVEAVRSGVKGRRFFYVVYTNRYSSSEQYYLGVTNDFPHITCYRTLPLPLESSKFTTPAPKTLKRPFSYAMR